MLLFFSSISFAPSWFSQGVFHPLLTPSHILLILGLGLLIAQQQRQITSLLFFSISIFLGLILNQMTDFDVNFSFSNGFELSFELILLVLGLVISLLVIIKLSLPKMLVWLIVLIAGLALGFDSSPILIPGLGMTSVYNWLAGAATSFIGVMALTILIAYFVNKFWNGIVLRVLASWIATSAIFVLTFMLLKH